MKLDSNTRSCQIPNFPRSSEGPAKIPPQSLARRLRLFLRRSINSKQVRALKGRSARLGEHILLFLGRPRNIYTIPEIAVPSNLQPGDIVRIRSYEEIHATLDQWGILKGCMFMPKEMSPYCGTIHSVMKRLERFVDERDYRVKKCSGVVLLENLMCRGTTDYGRCDRSCYFFWREEWLEKLESMPHASAG